MLILDIILVVTFTTCTACIVLIWIIDSQKYSMEEDYFRLVGEYNRLLKDFDDCEKKSKAKHPGEMLYNLAITTKFLWFIFFISAGVGGSFFFCSVF